MLLRVIFTLLYLLITCAASQASPAAPHAFDLVQPDGSRIKAFVRGDEFQNWTESADTGHTIIRHPTTGYWEYAELAQDGTLRPSGIRVLPWGLNAPAEIPKEIKPPRRHDLEQQMQQMVQQSLEQGTSATDTTAQTAGAPPASGNWTPTPVSGQKKLLVILVSFADRAIATTPASWSNAIFDAAAKSVAKFYKDNSFDTLTVSPVSHTQAGNPAGVVSVSISSNHPNQGGNFTFASDQAWGNSALLKAASFVDFNSFDTNGDGRLGTSEIVIYFIAAGYETAVGTGLSPSMWAHAWNTTGTGLTAGSKNVQQWALNGELYDTYNQMTMGVITHELGHQICGLPDLYDISNNNQGLGSFSLMASGNWGANVGEYAGTTPVALDAWSREYLGWATPVTPAGSSSLSFGHALSSRSAPYKLINSSKSTTEYFLVENRMPTSWDLGLRSNLGGDWNGGLLILHLDITAGTKGSNDINSYAANYPVPGHQGVVPVQASTAYCNMLSPGAYCPGNGTNLFFSGNNSAWSPITTPNSNYYNGTSTNFTLSAISAPAAIMTAEFILGPTISITSHPGAFTNNPQATFSFSSSDPAATFTCKIDNGSYTSCTTPYTTTALPDGSHTFTVRASNSAGSNETSYSWTSDTMPPATNLNSMPAASTTASTAVFTFSSTETTATFECKIDNDSYAPCSSGVTYSNLAPGSHSFSVRAKDSAGNSDQTPESYSWFIEACYARIVSTCYASIGDAYAAAIDDDTIMAQAVVFPESLVADRGIRLHLHGGYDSSFSNVVGQSVMQPLTIISDTVTVANVAL